MAVIRCVDETDLIPAAEQLIATFPEARVFAIYGRMGAGKTTFVKAICKVLGVIDVVQSPTFAIIHEYRRTGGTAVYHFDFYRIVKIEELFDIGYEEYVWSGNYCFLEWPEMVEAILPPDVVKVTITGDQERTITF